MAAGGEGVELSKLRVLDAMLQERDGKRDHSENWGPAEKGQSGAVQERTCDGWVQAALPHHIIVFHEHQSSTIHKTQIPVRNVIISKFFS